MYSESRSEVYDAVIVGSGIAGLRAAIELGTAGARVAVIAKDSPIESNTGRAQGGIAAAISDEDRIEFHFQDTLRAGDGLCDEAAVRILVEEGPARIQELIEWGTRFDREGNRLALAREGAHSRSRVLHAGGDSTGREILLALLSRAVELPRLSFFNRTFSIDLVRDGSRCVGVLVQDESSGKVKWVGGGAILLATGGAGRLYRETTNPPQATGDGVAMAYRAGAAVADLEFFQFHPTALFAPPAPRFLVSEALRGEGARLLNGAGERFLDRYHPEGELASRDVVARAMVAEMERRGDPCVYLDMTQGDPDRVRRRFPTIYETCLRFGFDLTRDRIPVHPSAHYLMGGVRTDLDGRTDLAGLYAAGEVACTGVHGANRLASNSLLEGLVFGFRSGAAMKAEARPPGARRLSVPDLRLPSPDRAAELAREIGEAMWSRVGIQRDADGLRSGRQRIEDLGADFKPAAVTREAVEARNLQVVAGLVAEAALEREESRGAHYRTDFPRRREEWAHRREVAPPGPAPDLPRPA